MRIYTRTGDAGETGLFGGGRVPKDHARVQSYGDVDELNSTLGLARATEPGDFSDALLESIQRDLFASGGHLATPDPTRVREALEKASLSADRSRCWNRPSTRPRISCRRSAFVLRMAPWRCFTTGPHCCRRANGAWSTCRTKRRCGTFITTELAVRPALHVPGCQPSGRSRDVTW
jgi:hypothetical protein